MNMCPFSHSIRTNCDWWTILIVSYNFKNPICFCAVPRRSSARVYVCACVHERNWKSSKRQTSKTWKKKNTILFVFPLVNRHTAIEMNCSAPRSMDRIVCGSKPSAYEAKNPIWIMFVFQIYGIAYRLPNNVCILPTRLTQCEIRALLWQAITSEKLPKWKKWQQYSFESVFIVHKWIYNVGCIAQHRAYCEHSTAYQIGKITDSIIHIREHYTRL